MDATTNGLHRHDLFARLNVDEIKQLDKFSHIVDYAKGDSVFKLQDKCSHIYMLMEGTVHLMLPDRGQELNLAFARVIRNEIFGLSALMNHSHYTAEARCISGCRVMAIEAKPLLQLLEENKTVGFDIVSAVSRIYYHRYLQMLTKLQDIVSQVTVLP